MISANLSRTLGRLCDGPVATDVASAKLVTLRAGGPLAVVVAPMSVRALESVWTFCHREGLATLLLGKGSNLLVADGGFAGVAFELSRALGGVRIQGNVIEAGAAVSLPALARLAADRGLTGAEFLIGVPGTVGGAIVMNAGCHGKEMAQAVLEVRSLGPDGSVRVRQARECAFGPRRSRFQREAELILGVRVAFSPGNRETIAATMGRDLAERKRKEPWGQPSCGSVFKNPSPRAAWELIAAAGLRGRCCGGAQISERHANFIVNRDRATASDILRLMDLAQQEVLRRSGVALEPEVVVVGA